MDDANFQFLAEALHQREKNSVLRKLTPFNENTIDFFSNDYLGFARNEDITHSANQLLINYFLKNGSTGSRLISGQTKLHEETEKYIAEIYQAPSALIYNSGYDANIGFWSCVPQRSDIILYDELIHASIRDGIRLSYAKSYSFNHNSANDLKNKIEKNNGRIFVAVESVYSMDGDILNENIIELSKKTKSLLVVDEAHALGVLGNNGLGLFNQSNLQKKAFARIVTFGKGLGCHGAAILGADVLKKYLINFSRSFIYTTSLSPHSIATVYSAFMYLLNEKKEQESLTYLINYFNQQAQKLNLQNKFVSLSSAAIKAFIPGNKEQTQIIEKKLNNLNIQVKAVYEPTVPTGKERIRICIHSFNTVNQIDLLLKTITEDTF